jgi:shikimate kinase
MKLSHFTTTTPIFLAGFMGCGKSAAGKALAVKLARPFIDLDQRIEAVAMRTIADLITQEGEEYFRRMESKALREAAQAAGAIIALGGGAVIRAENRALIENSGIWIWLDAPFELCWQRIERDRTARPLAPNETEARARYDQRLPFYQQAVLRIAVSETQSAEELADEIIQQLSVGEHQGLRAGE